MFKLMGKKIITILRSKSVLISSYYPIYAVLYTYRCSCTSKCRWDLPTLKKKYNSDEYLSLQHWMNLFNFLTNESIRIYSLLKKLAKYRGGSRISGKGVHMYKGVGVRFADFISFFLNIT